jgi:hypothetical protein
MSLVMPFSMQICALGLVRNKAFAKGDKIMGPKVLLEKLGGKNCNFAKVSVLKKQFSQYIFSSILCLKEN